jgi:FtsP/CotA-like multicopper oxidase with cupredoxin domain
LLSEDTVMDSRIKRPARSAVSLGLGAALLVTAGVVATTPVMSALASQGSAVRPAAVSPAAGVTAHATVLRAPTAVSALTGLGAHPLAGDCASVNDCSLVARTGSVTVNGQALAVWKFAPDTPATDVVAGARSAVLVGQVGQTMTIHLRSTLAQPVGLSIPQLDFDPAQSDLQSAGIDSAGAPKFKVATSAAGGDVSYTFTPQRPGTYLYQAALTGDGSRQVAMGLVGALIVRPAAAAATPYDTAQTVVNDEALMVYTDVDSRLATAAATSLDALNSFNMRTYRPDYHLINGVAYPDPATTIPTDHGHQLLLRVVNGSILEKSPTILGTRMAVFAKGARPLPGTLNVSGRLLATGDTFDATLQMPVTNSRYAIYDAPGVLSNGSERAITSPSGAPVETRSPNALAMGGALAFIDNGAAGTSSAGPVVTGLAAVGQPGGTNRPITVSATLTTTAPRAVVTRAELYVDSLGSAPIPVTLNQRAARVRITLPPMDVHLWTTGTHTVWLRGLSNNGIVDTWGPFASIPVQIDNTGPAVVGLGLSSSHVNGTLDVAITATLDERNTGAGLAGGPFGSPATGTGARFWVNDSASDPTVGSFAKVDIATNGPLSVASVDGVLTQAQMVGLADGTHTLWLEGRDQLGQWGTPIGTTLVVDRQAPLTTLVTLNPSATNGLVGSPNKPGNVTITATVVDKPDGTSNSPVTTVEGYVGTVKASNSADSLYFSPIGGDVWQADMPLAWLASHKSDGDITIVVVGTDSAGNRSTGSGPSERTTILMDRTKPTATISALTTTNGESVLHIDGAFAEVIPTPTAPTSGIAFAEWFIGADPGLGQATRIAGPYLSAPLSNPVSIDYNLIGTGLSLQNVTVTLRTKDAAGNVATTSRRIAIGAIPATFANGFAVADRQQWTAGPLGVPGAARTLQIGRIAGQRALSVTLGSVGYYEKSLRGVVSGDSLARIKAGFTLVLGRTYSGCTATSCKTATVFTGVSASGRDVVTVQYQRRSATSKPLFRVVVATGSTGTKVTAGRWTAVPVAASYSVTVGWTSSTQGRAVLRVNRTVIAPVSASTAGLRVATLRLGIVKAASRASGRVLFDTFYLV